LFFFEKNPSCIFRFPIKVINNRHDTLPKTFITPVTVFPVSDAAHTRAAVFALALARDTAYSMRRHHRCAIRQNTCKY